MQTNLHANMPKKPSKSLLKTALGCFLASLVIALLFFIFVKQLSKIPPEPDFFTASYTERRDWKNMYGGAHGGYVTGVVLTSIAFAALTALWIVSLARYSAQKTRYEEYREEHNLVPAPVPKAPKKAETKQDKFCVYCGAMYADGATHCDKCGAARTKD